MKRIICLLLSFICIFSFSVKAECVSTSASSAILYCKDNGKVYYSQNENTKSKIASTTKIMTALLALEYAEKNNKKVKFTADMIAEGSSMYLKLGEVVTLRDLAIGLLLCSGNDAANATAIAISGSIEKFAVRMNNRAEKIGMENTHFANPSGLDDPDHYSTAYDMALLMCEAMENKDFAEITAMKTATVNFKKPKDKIATYSNHNRLLSMYEYCIGGKTGYTMASGRCLVTVAKKDGLTLICVTINDRQDYNDHINLYNSVFEKYCLTNLDDRQCYYNVNTENGISSTTTACCNDKTNLVLSQKKASKIKRKLNLYKNIKAPVQKGDTLGTIIYTLKGKTVATHTLVAAEDNPCKVIRLWDYIKEFFKNALQLCQITKIYG